MAYKIIDLPAVGRNMIGTDLFELSLVGGTGSKKITGAEIAAGVGAVTSVTATGPILSSGGFTPIISIPQATISVSGYLSATDFTTFNNKQDALTFGTLTEDTSSVLTIIGGTGAVIGSGTSIQIAEASASQSGYLSSANWTTFNNKGNGSVTTATATVTNPSMVITNTNPTTTSVINIDDSNMLYNKFMVNQFMYLLPMDGTTVYDTLRAGGTVLGTGTITSLSGENPMGISYATAAAVGSVSGQYGTSFFGTFGASLEFVYTRRFRITTNNGAQRLFVGLSSLYATVAPTNVEPTSLLNSVGVGKLTGAANLYFIWNGTGTAQSLDLGAGFLGTDTACTYTLQISKLVGVAAVNLKLIKVVNSTGVTTETSLQITSNYNTGVNNYPFAWIGNNPAVVGACSMKDYGAIMTKHTIINS